MQKKALSELLEIIVDGSLDHDDIQAMLNEVIAAADDAAAYLANDPQSAYRPELNLPLWQWVLLEQLEDGLLFRADDIPALYAQIIDAFGDDELELPLAGLDGLSEQAALYKVQDELEPTFTLVNFSQPFGARWQTVLVRNQKLSRFLDLAKALEIPARPSDLA
ncbi:hypothetical protein [Chitinibacter sp. ZOR0017]|uniref:hypothetical protein n=1 Tax=Chitinibacter sp. ZOR0017 TaxID=1339254 RepID=UPI0012DFECB9|nr:hypothetical protein [Chitinibacter sp. ZOR0017]